MTSVAGRQFTQKSRIPQGLTFQSITTPFLCQNNRHQLYRQKQNSSTDDKAINAVILDKINTDGYGPRDGGQVSGSSPIDCGVTGCRGFKPV